MTQGRAHALSTMAIVAVLACPAGGQSVISTRSGVVHYFEGVVYLGGEPLEPRLGKFPAIPEGAELRTAQGRAEVLLTPGVFLRVGERSMIRLAASDLSDTRVQLLAGSAIVDAAEPSPDTSVTLIYKDWRVRLLQKGMYRIDSEPPRLSVNQGEVEVSAGASGTPVSVREGMDLPFAPVLVPDRSRDAPADALATWANGRSESITADNAIAAQIDEDPASRPYGLALNSFTYFPLIGASSFGLYNSFTPYQPGFNSIYLPGYTYRPLLLGLGLGGYRGYSGYRSYAPSRPWRPGFSPGARTIVPAPRAPVSPARPVTRGGFHGAHR